MNIYLLSQDINSGDGTYDSCVVYAASAADAQQTHPHSYSQYYDTWQSCNWADRPDQVVVKLIGVADATELAGIVCASYNGR